MVGAALHRDWAPGPVVENLVSRDCNPVCAMENNARVRHCHVRNVDDIPTHYNIVVPAFSYDRRTFALFDHIACYRVARGARRIQLNSYSKGSCDRLDAGYHIPCDHCSIGSGVKLGVALSLKNQDTFADCLQDGTPHDRTIRTTHLKADDFLHRRHAADGHATHIAYVLRGIVRVKMCRIRRRRSTIRNDNISLHAIRQGTTAAPGRYRMSSMRKTATRDADVLRSRADRDPVVDVCRWLLVANVMDIAIRDVRVKYRQQLNAANVGVMRFDTFYLQIVDKPERSETGISGVEWSQRGDGKIRQRYVSENGNARHCRRARD